MSPATVHNQGDGDAAATTLRYYLARLFHTTYADNEVGADAVAELVPAGSSEKSLTRNAPTDARAKHFYRACVDAPPHETDKRNNCTAWVRYYLSNPQGRPNLVPVAFLPSVGNYGDRKSAPTTLRWYVTTDSEPDSDETGSPVFTPENEIRTYAVGEIYPWAMSSDSFSPLPLPTNPATTRTDSAWTPFRARPNGLITVSQHMRWSLRCDSPTCLAAVVPPRPRPERPATPTWWSMPPRWTTARRMPGRSSRCRRRSRTPVRTATVSLPDRVPAGR